MIKTRNAVVTRRQLLKYYTGILMNVDEDLSTNEKIATLINRIYGSNFEGTVTAEQLDDLEIDIEQYNY